MVHHGSSFPKQFTAWATTVLTAWIGTMLGLHWSFHSSSFPVTTGVVASWLILIPIGTGLASWFSVRYRTQRPYSLIGAFLLLTGAFTLALALPLKQLSLWNTALFTWQSSFTLLLAGMLLLLLLLPFVRAFSSGA
jgi:hypothetical protein